MTNQSELDKAIDGIKTIKPDTLSGREWEYIDQLLLAAKRVQDLEIRLATYESPDMADDVVALCNTNGDLKQKVQDLEKERDEFGQKIDSYSSFLANIADTLRVRGFTGPSPLDERVIALAKESDQLHTTNSQLTIKCQNHVERITMISAAYKQALEALVQQHIAAMAIITKHKEELQVCKKADDMYNAALSHPLALELMKEGKV